MNAKLGSYILRRTLYFIPIWLGVFLITFGIFRLNDPMSIAAVQMPQAPEDRLQAWVRNHNYHLPLFLNLPHHAESVRADGQIHPEFAGQSVFYSQFFLAARSQLFFDLGRDRTRRPIAEALAERAGPTLSVMAPALGITIILSMLAALLSAYLRDTPFDRISVFLSVAMMSIALPAWILAGNFVLGNVFKILPVYNHILPAIVIAVFANAGAQIRFYRSVFLEQMEQDYIRTARAKGASEPRVLGRHALRNSWIPAITQIALSVPFLITGSLLLEQFFGIPGLGDYMYSAIVSGDFSVIQALVYLGALFYMLSTLLTDIAYVIADPRIQLA